MLCLILSFISGSKLFSRVFVLTLLHWYTYDQKHNYYSSNFLFHVCLDFLKLHIVTGISHIMTMVQLVGSSDEEMYYGKYISCNNKH